MEPEWLASQAPVMTAVVALFHPHVEVVAHDVRRDRVVAVWNPLSGRKIGDPSLLEPELLQAVQTLFANLEQHTPPLVLLSQYLPGQYVAVREGQLATTPAALVQHRVGQCLGEYARACSAKVSFCSACHWRRMSASMPMAAITSATEAVSFLA